MAKIWNKQPKAGPAKAKNVYTGVFATTCQRYANAYFKDWVIPSAKYGFLFPDDVIYESYNVSFNKPLEEKISVDVLKEQAKSKGLVQFESIVIFGWKNYSDRTRAVFNDGQEIILPLSDCAGIGYMLQKLTNAIQSNTEIGAAPSSNVELKRTEPNAKVKQIQDHDLFVQEFQKLINSKNFTNMKIDEDENGVVIHLEGPLDVVKQQKRARLLKTLEKTAGLFIILAVFIKIVA